MTRLRPRSLRVYVVTSSGLAPGRGHRVVARAALDGGASAIQLRAPGMPEDELLATAEEIATWCRRAEVVFVVNDRVDVAAEVGAGAHVGQGDDPMRARAVLGDLPLGISVSTPEEAAAAERAGADYLGLTVWATPTKPEAEAMGLEGLRAVAGSVSLPVVAIGGIDATNAQAVLDAGAAGVAVVSAIGAAPDPVAATRELVAMVTDDRVGER
ncbi:MAG TPA: thiamine phosphate synthase [Actinomycetota bacterium]